MSALEVIALDPATPQLRAPGAGDSYLLPRSVEITETFNNAGVAFTALKLNVTDTASAAGSLLINLQVGGSSKFGVDKTGKYGSPVTGMSLSSLLFNGHPATGFYRLTETSPRALVGALGIQTHATGSLGFSSTDANALGALDVMLWRDAANTLAQRNGVNAQTSRIYGTYTDASNNRRLALSMSTAGVAEIKPEGAGTGASDNVLHISGLPTSNPGAGILWNDNGTVKVGT